MIFETGAQQAAASDYTIWIALLLAVSAYAGILMQLGPGLWWQDALITGTVTGFIWMSGGDRHAHAPCTRAAVRLPCRDQSRAEPLRLARRAALSTRRGCFEYSQPALELSSSGCPLRCRVSQPCDARRVA